MNFLLLQGVKLPAKQCADSPVGQGVKFLAGQGVNFLLMQGVKLLVVGWAEAAAELRG